VQQPPTIEPCEFVQAVQPLLESRDVQGLATLLRSRWTKDQLITLLRGRDTDARKVAMVALSLVGCRECLCELVHHLKDPDPIVNQVAEHAVWSIWFRLGPPQANCQVHKGVQALNGHRYDEAVEHFTQAIQIDPEFAEAWNQRAVAFYLMEKYRRSLADAHRAVALNPYHFGAWSGIGHCYAHVGKYIEAIEAYQRALEINPHLGCLAEAIEELRGKIA
jgi:tetratricopeptide (TPR) repeat protein